MKKQTSKQAKIKEIEALKDNIILIVLKLIDTDNKEIREEAIDNMKKLASFYRIPLVMRKQKKELLKTLINFIENKTGYIKLIPELYTEIIKR